MNQRALRLFGARSTVFICDEHDRKLRYQSVPWLKNKLVRRAFTDIYQNRKKNRKKIDRTLFL